MASRALPAPTSGLVDLKLVTKHFGSTTATAGTGGGKGSTYPSSRAPTPVFNYSHPRPDSRLQQRQSNHMSHYYARSERVVGRSSVGSEASAPDLLPDEGEIDDDQSLAGDEDHYHITQSQVFDSFWDDEDVKFMGYPALISTPPSQRHRATGDVVVHEDNSAASSPDRSKGQSPSPKWPLAGSPTRKLPKSAPRYSLFPAPDRRPSMLLPNLPLRSSSLPQDQPEQPQQQPPVAPLSPSLVLPPIASCSEISLSLFGPQSSSRPASPARQASFAPMNRSNLPDELPVRPKTAPGPPKAGTSSDSVSHARSHRPKSTEKVRSSRRVAPPTRPAPVPVPPIPPVPKVAAVSHMRPASVAPRQTAREFAPPLLRTRSATLVPAYSPSIYSVADPLAQPSPRSTFALPPGTPTIPEVATPTEVTPVSSPDEPRSYFDFDDSDTEASSATGFRGLGRRLVRVVQHKRSSSDTKRQNASDARRPSSKNGDEASKDLQIKKRTRAATTSSASPPVITPAAPPADVTASEKALRRQTSAVFSFLRRKD